MSNLETTITDLAIKMVDDFSQQVQGNKKKEMKKIDSTLCAVLDILVENGIAAMFLWLIEKDERQRQVICDGLLKTLNCNEFNLKNEDNNYKNPRDKDFFKQIGTMTADIDQTLFCRMILERVLIYARHWTKHYAA